MVFVRMAVRNVARNWNRTGMIILGMMVASGLMTLTMSLATGYHDLAYLPYRQMVGADILIYPNRFVFGSPGGEAGRWELRRPHPDLLTDARFFHPELARGYLSPVDAPPAVFDLENLPACLGEVEGVADWQPGRLLRAYVVSEEDGVRFRVTLRGRDITADRERYAMPGSVTVGRYFREEQDGEWVALVNDAVPELARLRPGSRLVLEVPTIRGFGPGGEPLLDYSEPRTYYFLVHGRYSLSLGTVPLQGVSSEDLAGPPPLVPVAIDEPEVWVPARTFDRIYAEVAGGPLRYTGQLGVTVESMFHAKTVARALAEALPHCSVLTVPQEAALSGLHYVAYLSEDGSGVGLVRAYRSRSTLAVDVRRELSYLAFLAAGLLVVANMYILVTQRRREIGVLKAVGSTGRDIVVLILTEAVGYSLTGSLIGFAAIRLLATLTLLGSSVTFVEGMVLTLEAAAVVVGTTTLTALVFGLLPAWEAARTPSAALLSDR